jgi:hypothetical protein
LLPVSLAPLNDVKCAYIEVANPYLANGVVKAARGLPENLRSKRQGFKAVASALGPQIPQAKHSALIGSSHLMSNSRKLTDEIIGELSSTVAERICERRGLDRVVSALAKPRTLRTRHRFRDAVRAVVPRNVRVRVVPDPAPTLSTFTLALRLHMASHMATMLNADAAALRDRSVPSSRPPDSTHP